MRLFLQLSAFLVNALGSILAVLVLLFVADSGNALGFGLYLGIMGSCALLGFFLAFWSTRTGKIRWAILSLLVPVLAVALFVFTWTIVPKFLGY